MGSVPLSGGRVAELIYEGDPDSRPVVHHRTVDTIGIMLRRGTITPAMVAAARDFAAAAIAGLDTLRVPSLLRVLGTPRAPELADGQVAARQARARGARHPGGRAGGARRTFRPCTTFWGLTVWTG
jgi:hypothetical protein